MANIHTITTAVGSMSMTTQVWVYKCPSCEKDIVSCVFTPNANNWTMNMNILGNVTLFGNAMSVPPEIKCSEHGQQVKLRSLTLNV